MSAQTYKPDSETEAHLAKIVNIIVEAVEPDKIFLFGSRARGDAGADSDYDLLIVKNGVSNERAVSRLAYRSLLEQGSDIPVDVVVADDAKLRKAKGRIGDVFAVVLSEGRQIYERA